MRRHVPKNLPWRYFLIAVTLFLGLFEHPSAAAAREILSNPSPANLESSATKIITPASKLKGATRNARQVRERSPTGETPTQPRDYLSDYQERGWQLIHSSGAEESSLNAEGDPRQEIFTRYFKLNSPSYEACPQPVQAFLSLFGLESLASEGNSYRALKLIPKVPKLAGYSAEFKISSKDSHLIVAWGSRDGLHSGGDEQNSYPSEFEADYHRILLTVWDYTVQSARRGEEMEPLAQHPLTHITISELKSPKTIEVLQTIQKRLGPGESGTLSMVRPESLDQEDLAAPLWAGLLGVPEISAIQRMLNLWSENFPAEYQITWIRCKIELTPTGGKAATILVSLEPNIQNTLADALIQESLKLSTNVELTEVNQDLKVYPAIEIFQNPTSEPGTQGLVMTGQKRKNEISPTYRRNRWLLLANVEAVENSLIWVSTSGPEHHLVLEDRISTDNKQVLGDLIYLTWLQDQGSKNLRDITFLQLSPATVDVILAAYKTKKIDVSDQQVLTLWGHERSWRKFARRPDTEPWADQEVDQALLRRFLQTLEYGAVLKMILQPQRYPNFRLGTYIRSLEIGLKLNTKKTKGEKQGVGPLSHQFAILIRLGDVEDDAPSVNLHYSATTLPFSADTAARESTPSIADQILRSLDQGLKSRLQMLNTIALRQLATAKEIKSDISKCVKRAKARGIDKFVYHFEPPLNNPKLRTPQSDIPAQPLMLAELLLKLELDSGRLHPSKTAGSKLYRIIRWKTEYFHFFLDIQAQGAQRNIGEFYVSLQSCHIVIAQAPRLSEPGDIENLSDILYLSFSKLSGRRENRSPHEIEFISVQNVTADTTAVLNELYDVFNLDKTSYLRFSVTNGILAEYASSWSRRYSHQDEDQNKKISSIILGTKELVAIQEMVVKYYAGTYLGRKIVDEVLITWQQERGQTSAPQILVWLKAVPEELKGSDLTAWIQSTTQNKDEDAHDSGLNQVPGALSETEASGDLNEVIVGQELIERINESLGIPGIESLSRILPDQPTGTGSDGLHLSRLPKLDRIDPPIGRTPSGFVYLMEGLLALEGYKVKWAQYSHVHLKTNIVKRFSQPGFLYETITYEERQTMILAGVRETSEIPLSQSERIASFAHVYSAAWLGEHGRELPELRYVLIFSPSLRSTNIIHKLLDFRETPCSEGAEQNKMITFSKPAAPFPVTPNNQFRIDTRDSLEWATLLGIAEIAGLVEVGLAQRRTKSSWFLPHSIIILCGPFAFRDMDLRIGLRVEHYSSETGARTDSNWLRTKMSRGAAGQG
ncbi:hypothetical protein TWF281_011068 [Arthrobotrys megalospora]